MSTISPSRTPRERVTLDVTTRDSAGQPVPAELALSVVDDTVVSFADDKTGHILSRLYLEPEIPGEVEEPKKTAKKSKPKAEPEEEPEEGEDKLASILEGWDD